MQLLILVAAMAAVGALIGWLAGFIWKQNRPIGVRGDFIAAILTAVAIGLLDWYVIPVMGFSNSLRNLGVALEPALSALLVLWLIRAARK